MNYITDNRLLTIAADLSHSINVEGCNFLGHYDPDTNPRGTRLKAGIQECVNAATMCGLVILHERASEQALLTVFYIFCFLLGVPNRV